MFSAFHKTAIGLGAATLAFAVELISPAQAAYVISLQQVGPDVVATGAGTIDLTDLTFLFESKDLSGISPSSGRVVLGASGFAQANVYGGIAGPASFGPGGGIFPASGVVIGGLAGVTGSSLQIEVPLFYVSNTFLTASTDTFANETFASIGITPGLYVWTWGSGTHADSLTLGAGVPVQVPVQPAPEPASLTVLALGLAGLGMVLRTRRA